MTIPLPARPPFSFAHFEVIDTAEMLRRERDNAALFGPTGAVAASELPATNATIEKLARDRTTLWRALRAAGATPHWKPMGACLLFTTTPSSGEVDPGASDFCDGRGVVRYAANRTLTEAQFLHLPTLPKQGLHWLTHFYSFIRFAEPMHDRFYRRFDPIFYLKPLFDKGFAGWLYRVGSCLLCVTVDVYHRHVSDRLRSLAFLD